MKYLNRSACSITLVIAAAEAARNGISPRERKSWGVTWAVTIRMMNGTTLAGMATSRQFNYYDSAFDTKQYYNKECILPGLTVHKFNINLIWQVHKVGTL
jgi:hypothetical protein